MSDDEMGWTEPPIPPIKPMGEGDAIHVTSEVGKLLRESGKALDPPILSEQDRERDLDLLADKVLDKLLRFECDGQLEHQILFLIHADCDAEDGTWYSDALLAYARGLLVDLGTHLCRRLNDWYKKQKEGE